MNPVQTETETPTEEAFESVVQRAFRFVIHHLSIANNAEKEELTRMVDGLYTPEPAPDDPQEIPEPATQSIGSASAARNNIDAPLNPTGIVAETLPAAQNQDANAVTDYPDTYPVNGSPEDVRNWYANASDEEINQVNTARMAGNTQ